MKNNYSVNIANKIKEFLTEDNWHYSFNEDNGTFRFGLSLRGKIKKVNYVVKVKEDSYIVYAISPVGADDRKGYGGRRRHAPAVAGRCRIRKNGGCSQRGVFLR